MANINSTLPPLTERSTVLRWLRKNLFGSWGDTLLTVLGILFVYWAVKGLLTWALTVAEWDVVSANMRLLMVGQYPMGQVSRLWLWLAFLVFLSGNSIGIWARQSRFAIGVLFLPALLALLPFGQEPRTWLITLTVLGVVGWGILSTAKRSLLRRPCP